MRQDMKCNISATMLIAQCQMARAALGLSVAELAKRSTIAARTIARFEAGETVKLDTVEALRRALVDAGATFIDMSGKVGVLVKP